MNLYLVINKENGKIVELHTQKISAYNGVYKREFGPVLYEVKEIVGLSINDGGAIE